VTKRLFVAITVSMSLVAGCATQAPHTEIARDFARCSTFYASLAGVMPEPTRKAEFRRAAEAHGHVSVFLSDAAFYTTEVDTEMRRLGRIFTGERSAMDAEVQSKTKFCESLGQQHAALIGEHSQKLKDTSVRPAR
jgi:hypothetical protein